jgi:predicted RNA-binding Zn ribbon-like protein
MTAAVPWPASARYLEAESIAPDGLGFVQDLLNTTSMGKPRQRDLLESVDTAQEWLDLSLAALGGWLPEGALPPGRLVLDARSLRVLRSLRDGIRTALANDPDADSPDDGALPSMETTAVMDLGAGGVQLRPRGKGVELLRSCTLMQLAAASYTGTMRRLKVCENPLCRGAFYDRSKNCSRVWHDVSTCGNTQNVRAYRARQKERAASASS